MAKSHQNNKLNLNNMNKRKGFAPLRAYEDEQRTILVVIVFLSALIGVIL
jgi:hypothetical protein